MPEMGENRSYKNPEGRGFIMIELKNICKAFGNQQLYKDFSLTIETGEFVVLSGKSGCGKTTLLNIIGGLENVDSGSVTVDGIDITGRKNKMAYFQKKAGFLFQNFALVDTKTVRENLDLIYKKSRSGISFEAALDKVGLSDKIDEKVYRLSGGEQQRAAVARLMVKQCDIILADEPTGSLDRENAEEIIRLLSEFCKMGRTVVMVTHDESFKNAGDRIVELSGAVREEDGDEKA